MRKIITFLKEARAELKKVNWPTRKELLDSTKVVLFSAVLLTAFIGLVDYILSKLINLLLG